MALSKKLNEEGETSNVDRAIAAEQHRQRIIEVVNGLTEEELEKVSDMLLCSEQLDQADRIELEEALTREKLNNLDQK